MEQHGSCRGEDGGGLEGWVGAAGKLQGRVRFSVRVRVGVRV